MRPVRLVLVGLLALLMIGCSESKYKDAVVGRWEIRGPAGMNFMELTADGKVRSSQGSGTYKLDGEDRIWMRLDGMDGKLMSKIVSIDANQMTIKDPDGSVWTFTRAGPGGGAAPAPAPVPGPAPAPVPGPAPAPPGGAIQIPRE